MASECEYMWLGIDLWWYVWVFAVFSVVLVTCNGARDCQPENNCGYVWVHMGT
jgi:hypothetical protein